MTQTQTTAPALATRAPRITRDEALTLGMRACTKIKGYKVHGNGIDDRGSSADRKARRVWLCDPASGFGGTGAGVPCVHCGHWLPLQVPQGTPAKIQADRIVPGVAGGRYVRGNIQPACGSCNQARKADPHWIFTPAS